MISRALIRAIVKACTRKPRPAEPEGCACGGDCGQCGRPTQSSYVWSQARGEYIRNPKWRPSR